MTINGGGEGVKLIAVNSVFLGLACVAVALRLFARAFRKWSLQLNDWLIIIALVCQIGQSVLQDLNAAYGSIGGPQDPEASSAAPWTGTLQFSDTIVWGLPLLFLKLSVLHYYYVSFPIRAFRWTCISMMILVIVYFVAYTVVVVLSCIPVSTDWNPSVHGDCINLDLRMQVTAALNLGIDVLLVVLPLAVIRRLDLSRRKWLPVCGIFALALSVCVVSALRILFLYRTGLEPEVNYYITTLLEPDIGIVVACLPISWPTMKDVIAGRAGSPYSDTTDINRWSPDPSTLLDEEEMTKRVQPVEKSKISKPLTRTEVIAKRPTREDKPVHAKPQARDESTLGRAQQEEKTLLMKSAARENVAGDQREIEEKAPLVKPQARDESTPNRSRFEERTTFVRPPPRIEAPVTRANHLPQEEDTRGLMDRAGDRNSHDRPLSRLMLSFSGRPLSWRRRADWPLSDDVERELSGKSSVRVSAASEQRGSTDRPSVALSLDEPPKISEDTIRAAIRTSQSQAQKVDPLQRDPRSVEPPARNPDRIGMSDGITRKNSAAEILTSATAVLESPIPINPANIPRGPSLRLRTERSEALGGASEDHAPRSDTRTPLSPLRSPIGRSPALTPPPPKRASGSPALQPGNIPMPTEPMPPLPANPPVVPLRRSKSAKERSSKDRTKKEASEHPLPSAPRQLVVERKPIATVPFKPGFPPPPVTAPRADIEERRVRRDMTKSMSNLDGLGNRESYSAELDSEWGRELLRSLLH